MSHRDPPRVKEMELVRGPAVVAVGLRTFTSLRNRNFRVYWLGMLASFMAMQMQQLARGWLVYEMTGSALALGIVSAAFGAPLLFFSLGGGVLADRVEKRNLILVTQALVGIITLAIAALIALGSIQFWQIIAYTLITSTIQAFSMPGRQAIIPELVGEGELMNAIALNSSGMNLTRIVAPALAGFLVYVIDLAGVYMGVGGVYVGVAGVYFLVVACYGLVVLALSLIPISGTVALRPDVPLREDLVQGLNYVRRNSTILTLLAMELGVVLLGWPYMMLLPIFAVDVLKVGSSGLGLLMTFTGVGALLSTLTIASLGEFRHKGLLLLSLAFGFGVALILFANSPFFSLSLLFLLLVGMGSTGYLTMSNTLLQMNITDEVRGRVMSISSMTFGLQPLGTLPASAVASVMGAPFAVSAGGILLLLAVVSVALLRPSLRRLP